MIYQRTAASYVSVNTYVAFMSAYGMLSGIFTTLQGLVPQITLIKPMLATFEPLLKTTPEKDMNHGSRTDIKGEIALSKVSFRYDESQAMLLDDFSLSIRQGEYLAIVGKSGSGKSTLMRLMLGFETPLAGAVYYDGNDIASMDLQYLRKQMGIVTQDGKLFPGSIYENIAITHPGLSMDECWETAEKAGIAEDIRNMPMGMHTLLDDHTSSISGGQRQRILIARAIAADPKVLLFDEATSALDNLTQKIVIDSLRNMNCTRVVIAHRLSTVQDCDRIVMIDHGKIAESGTYEELMTRDGAFAQMVRRQTIA